MIRFVLGLAAGLALTPLAALGLWSAFFDQPFSASTKDLQVKVVVYPSLAALNKAHGGDTEILGFVYFNGTTCVINVPKLSGDNDPLMATYGHELVHCLYGPFHD